MMAARQVQFPRALNDAPLNARQDAPLDVVQNAPLNAAQGDDQNPAQADGQNAPQNVPRHCKFSKQDQVFHKLRLRILMDKTENLR